MAREFNNTRKSAAVKKAVARAPRLDNTRFGAPLVIGGTNAEGVYTNEKGEVRIEVGMLGDKALDRSHINRYKHIGARVDTEESDDSETILWLPIEKREDHIRKAQDEDVRRQSGNFSQDPELENPRLERQAPMPLDEFAKNLPDAPLTQSDLEQLV